jgi:hypothetical protein
MKEPDTVLETTLIGRFSTVFAVDITDARWLNSLPWEK